MTKEKSAGIYLYEGIDNVKDYYKILEVNKDASNDVIAKIYKFLAKKYHPDLQNEQNKEYAEAKFKEISEAYEVLSNEKSREEYDRQLDAQNRENSVTIEDYENMRNYCIQLETELNQLRNIYANNNYQQNSYVEQNQYQPESNVYQSEQEYGQDSYDEIRYKKTFKRRVLDIIYSILLIITAYIVFRLIVSVNFFSFFGVY